MSKQPKIYIIDVTNRDGVQTSRICLSKLEKTMINIYLNKMGVFQSEFGFPVTPSSSLNSITSIPNILAIPLYNGPPLINAVLR